MLHKPIVELYDMVLILIVLPLNAYHFVRDGLVQFHIRVAYQIVKKYTNVGNFSDHINRWRCFLSFVPAQQIGMYACLLSKFAFRNLMFLSDLL